MITPSALINTFENQFTLIKQSDERNKQKHTFPFTQYSLPDKSSQHDQRYGETLPTLLRKMRETPFSKFEPMNP